MSKDSTAMLLEMVERGIPIDRILYVNMGSWEFPQMAAHIDKVEQFINRPIERLQLAKPLDYWLYQHPHKNSAIKGYGWPRHWLRWCTREKVQRFRKEIKNSDTIYLGYAADEKHRNRPLKKGQPAYPLQEWGWTEKDCLNYCLARGFDCEGLFRIFDRVSCWCCPLQPISELKKLWRHFPELWEQLKEMERQVRKNCGRTCPFTTDYFVTDWERRFHYENVTQARLFEETT